MPLVVLCMVFLPMDTDVAGMRIVPLHPIARGPCRVGVLRADESSDQLPYTAGTGGRCLSVPSADGRRRPAIHMPPNVRHFPMGVTDDRIAALVPA
jgi:hypothetical protein